MTTRQTLEAARDLITPKDRWMQGFLTDGQRFCALGALRKVANAGDRHPALMALKDAVPNRLVAAYNDSHSHECVLAAFDAAIEREKEKEHDDNS